MLRNNEPTFIVLAFRLKVIAEQQSSYDEKEGLTREDAIIGEFPHQVSTWKLVWFLQQKDIIKSSNIL